jgi:hypothetical protein
MDTGDVTATTEELREARGEAEALLQTLRAIRQEVDGLKLGLLVQDELKPAREEAQALSSALDELGGDEGVNLELLADELQTARQEAEGLLGSLKEADELRAQ